MDLSNAVYVRLIRSDMTKVIFIVILSLTGSLALTVAFELFPLVLFYECQDCQALNASFTASQLIICPCATFSNHISVGPWWSNRFRTFCPKLSMRYARTIWSTDFRCRIFLQDKWRKSCGVQCKQQMLHPVSAYGKSAIRLFLWCALLNSSEPPKISETGESLNRKR